MNAQTLTQGGASEAQASIAAMEAAISGFERTTISDLLEQQADLLEKSKEVGKIDDTVLRAARMEIIQADMASLEKKIGEYREDTAELIAGLEAQFEKLGLDLSALQKPAPEDLEVVTRAEAYLQQLETEAARQRVELDQEIAEAGNAWFGKEQKVKDAETALEAYNVEHEQQLATAKVAIEEAKAEVERRKRKRIRDADFDSQFNRFIGVADAFALAAL